MTNTQAEVVVIAAWNFNSDPSDAKTATGTRIPFVGNGSAVLVGVVRQEFVSGSPGDRAANDNSGWNISGFPPQRLGNKRAGVQFDVSTSGKQNIVISWDQRVSPTASRYSRLQYSTNRTDFIDFAPAVVMRDPNSFESKILTLVGIEEVNDNPNFAFRIVTEFESTAIDTANRQYVTASGSDYSTVGTVRFDRVTVSGETIAALRCPIYSIDGLFQFDMTGPTGASYVVQASTNLTDWACLRTNVSPFTFTDADASFFSNRFYRAVYLPQ